MTGFVCTMTTFVHTFLWGMLAGGLTIVGIIMACLIVAAKSKYRKRKETQRGP